ncbi:uncharacterized protein LOC120666187 [Panicum virgatum]|uniref:Uncharacterized protein n=1 Tax=Panicum virgatum TaxID=38727 RepID=A0A8T0UFF9_PANVG|nr:uncharacterized protein LOC120666187 [Panicum virgatum]KAG2620798.1 hypothetical protein PVAP13_3NG198400 [Panicum virgatum]
MFLLLRLLFQVCCHYSIPNFLLHLEVPSLHGKPSSCCSLQSSPSQLSSKCAFLPPSFTLFFAPLHLGNLQRPDYGTSSFFINRLSAVEVLGKQTHQQRRARPEGMAACRRDRRIEESAWVAEVEAVVADGGASEEEVARWRRHCIYHVPACIKDLNPKAYRPQVVSLGPFHHGEAQLRPMDAHKRRALVHFLRRARRPLAEFAAVVAGGAAAEEYERLEGAYEGLGGEWRAAAGEERFVELMVTDGCFLLEVIRAASGWEVNDYAADDPVFSPHGLLYTVPYIRRDMLLIENQLPLLVLDRLLAVETGKDGVRVLQVQVLRADFELDLIICTMELFKLFGTDVMKLLIWLKIIAVLF